MKTLLFTFCLVIRQGLALLSVLLFTFYLGFAQSGQYAVVFKGASYIVMKGGTSTVPLYFIIKQTHRDGITQKTTNQGWFVNKTNYGGEYNKLQWDIRTGTGKYVMPFRTPSGIYIPFKFDVSSAGTESGIGTGKLRVSTYATWNNNKPYPYGDSVSHMNNQSGDNSHNAADRFWVIDVLGYSNNPTTTVTFTYAEADLNDTSDTPIPEANLQAQRWNDTTWVTPPVGTVNTINNYVEVTGISTFSPWVLVDKDNPLPIELLSFSGICKDGVVELKWATATEINNDYFTIEYLTPALSEGEGVWTPIGIIDGAGNSNTIQYYSFISPLPLEKGRGNELYYRLKQTDFDGSYKYSEIISVKCDWECEESFDVFPVPSDGKNINILFESCDNNEILIVVQDVLGKVLYSKVIVRTFADRQTIYALAPYKQIPPGIYFVIGSSNNKFYNRKIVVQ